MASKVTPALFVQLYMESHKQGHTLRQFADRIQMPYRRMSARLYQYRKRGVKLPSLRPACHAGGRGRIDVRALNELVESSSGDGAPSRRQLQRA